MIVVFQEGVPIITFDPFNFVLNILKMLFGILSGPDPLLASLASAINVTWSNFILSAGFLYNAVQAVTQFLKSLILIIVRGLQHIISDILHGHLLNALHDIQKLFHALHDLFKPILNFINTLRGWYYKYIYKWIKLVQDILSAVRVILSAFRILGAKWAAKLDADIARIQGYITTVMQAIVGTLNQATTWLNFMTDPIGILRSGFFNNTLFSSLGQLNAAVNFGKDRFLTASEAQNTHDDISMAGGGAAILTKNADGSIAYSAAVKRSDASAVEAWNYYGGPKLSN